MNSLPLTLARSDSFFLAILIAVWLGVVVAGYRSQIRRSLQVLHEWAKDNHFHIREYKSTIRDMRHSWLVRVYDVEIVDSAARMRRGRVAVGEMFWGVFRESVYVDWISAGGPGSSSNPGDFATACPPGFEDEPGPPIRKTESSFPWRGSP